MRYADPDIVALLSLSQLKLTLVFLLCEKIKLSLFRPLLMCLFIAPSYFQWIQNPASPQCNSFYHLNKCLVSYPPKYCLSHFNKILED